MPDLDWEGSNVITYRSVTLKSLLRLPMIICYVYYTQHCIAGVSQVAA